MLVEELEPLARLVAGRREQLLDRGVAGQEGRLLVRIDAPAAGVRDDHTVPQVAQDRLEELAGGRERGRRLLQGWPHERVQRTRWTRKPDVSHPNSVPASI